ncbi:hypothetical protein ACFP63_06895 [Oerskovia jenensis]|uniref:DUF8094 domain-containing protein n=1 Tax=Oerskovia jenensis TaxID=162169 RepID=A0ABS2LH74_9CELL|nr:hypothetical protein [Oerskovia jenensis]MBM7479775.1 hypothetical protein [Oerskovia jenensis]
MPVLRPSARPLAGLIGAVASLGLLSGCVGTEVAAAPAQVREPAIDHAAAATLFGSLSATRNAANAARDPAVLARIGTGPVLRSSTFAFAAQSAQSADPVAPHTSVPGTLAAPTAGTADWFYSLGAQGDPAASDGEFVESTLFTRVSADAPWLLTYQLATDPALALPQPVLTGGTAVGPDDAGRARGDAALDEVLDFARTGQAAPTLDVTDADQLATAHAQGFPVPDLSPASGTEERSCGYEEPGPAWLTAAEGIFTLVSVECTQTVALTGGWTAPTPTTGTLGTVPPGVRLSAWTVTQTVTVLVEVHDDGTSRVVGSRLRPVRTDVTLAP